jgi:hypothetical protein
MKHAKIVSFILLSLFALGCILFLPKTKADVIKSKYFNYVEKGAKIVKTSPSTQYKLMETYPQSTVTVYEAGTLNLASLWVDRDGLIIKANPFTADTDSFYYFYVDCGKYDIKFSGTGIAVPYSYGDVFICGALSGDALDFAVGTDGTDFNVAIAGATVTYNLPDASLLNRGAVTILAQSFNGDKTFDDNVLISSNIINSFLYSDSSKAVQTTTAPLNGQLLIGSTGLAPAVANITSLSPIVVTNGAGSIQLSCPTCGSSSGGLECTACTDNVIPKYHAIGPDFIDSAITSGASTISTILPLGVYNNSSPANGQLLIGNTVSSTFSKNTLTGTSPIVVTNGNGTITLSCPTCVLSTAAPAPPQFAVQFNDPLGTFAGSDKFLFTPSNTRLTIGNDVPSTHGNIRLYRGEGSGAFLDIGWGNAEFNVHASGGDLNLTSSNGTGPVYINNNKWRFDGSGNFIPFGSNNGFVIGDSTHVVNTLHMWKQIKFYDQVGQNLTVSTPFINHEVTWNNAGVTFVNFISNVLDSASASGSLLMDLQVGGSSKFKIDKAGNVTIAGATNVASHCYAANVCDFFGSGTPEGSLSANVGSTYRRTDGGAATSFYVKESGTGNTGWIAK